MESPPTPVRPTKKDRDLGTRNTREKAEEEINKMPQRYPQIHMAETQAWPGLVVHRVKGSLPMAAGTGCPLLALGTGSSKDLLSRNCQMAWHSGLGLIYILSARARPQPRAPPSLQASSLSGLGLNNLRISVSLSDLCFHASWVCVW